MRKNKYRVTVNGWFKLLATLFFLVVSMTYIFPASDAAGLAMLAYTLLFVFLAVNGSNSKIAEWISQRKLFYILFFAPTVFCAFFAFALYGSDDNIILAAFSILLTILSIPFALLMMFSQGGIRRWNAFAAFVALPVCLFVLCIMFPMQIITVALCAAGLTLLAFFLVSLIQSFQDHRADSASGRDKAESGHYTAKWESDPYSDVSNQVIHLRGNILVTYYGSFYQDSADEAVNGLINQYIARVAGTMPGYTVDGANLHIRYQKLE